MADKVYKGDIGTIIRLDVNTDLTGYTSRLDPGPPDPHTVFKVKEPDGTEVDWICDHEGSPIDGILYHEITSGEIDQVGDYKIQAQVVFDPDVFFSETITLTVHDEYK